MSILVVDSHGSQQDRSLKIESLEAVCVDAETVIYHQKTSFTELTSFVRRAYFVVF